MGIDDRHYARVGPRSSSGLGNLRVISFNTWLIILNVAIFVVNNLVLSDQKFQVAVPMGTEYAPDVTSEQQKRAVVPPNAGWRPHPNIPGWIYKPIIDPTIPDRDQFGRMLINTTTGEPAPVIGRERYAPMPVIQAYGHFSTGKAIADFQVWRFLTFQFLHYNWVHLLFNMLGLWFVGGMVEQHLGAKRYAAFYLVCGIFGALMYLLLNLVGYIVGTVLAHGDVKIPGLLFNDIYTPLIGASAGVFGVLIAAARLEPDELIYVYMLVPLRLRWAVLGLFSLTLFNLFFGTQNTGGEAAHVGGALAGFYFAKRPYLLRDFFSIIGDSRPHRPGPAPVGAVSTNDAEIANLEPEVERILRKGDEEGIQSLTDREKGVLRRFNELRQGG